jgi:hypothetical protein
VYHGPYKKRKYNAHLWGHIILRFLLKLFRIPQPCLFNVLCGCRSASVDETQGSTHLSANDRPTRRLLRPSKSHSAGPGISSRPIPRHGTHLADIELFDPDDLDILFLLLQSFQQRLRQHQVIPPAVIDRERRESIVEPSVEGIIERALAMRETALAAPPEDTGGAYWGGREAEHFGFAAVEPVEG